MLKVLALPILFHVFSRSALPPAPRQQSKITHENIPPKSFQKMIKFIFFFRRVAETTPKIPPRSPPQSPPGTLKSINFSPLGGPGAQPTICFAPPGRPQEPFGVLLAPTLGPHGAQKRPGGLQALISCPPGPFWEHFLLIFDDFSTLVSHSFHVMFLFVFACLLVLPLCFWKASKKVGSPRSLKPWLAAGGREAI